MYWSYAMAQATAAAPAGEQPSFLMSMVPFIFMIGVFYFLILRPQAKRQREHQGFLSNLKRGEEVITSGGILGRIEGITDTFVNLEVSDGVRIRVLRSQIASSAKLDKNTNKG